MQTKRKRNAKKKKLAGIFIIFTLEAIHGFIRSKYFGIKQPILVHWRCSTHTLSHNDGEGERVSPSWPVTLRCRWHSVEPWSAELLSADFGHGNSTFFGRRHACSYIEPMEQHRYSILLPYEHKHKHTHRYTNTIACATKSSNRIKRHSVKPYNQR